MGEGTSPDDIQALVAYGATRLGEGDVLAAVRAFNAALAIDPDWVPARLGRAEVFRRVGRLPDAFLAYGELAAEHPGEPEVIRCLRLCASQMYGRIRMALTFGMLIALIGGVIGFANAAVGPSASSPPPALLAATFPIAMALALTIIVAGTLGVTLNFRKRLGERGTAAWHTYLRVGDPVTRVAAAFDGASVVAIAVLIVFPEFIRIPVAALAALAWILGGLVRMFDIDPISGGRA